jgi:TPR repeat protein
VGYNAYQSGRLMEAEQLWRRAVDLGDAVAMFNLGALLEGRGETGEAERLYRRAAARDHEE